MATFFEWFCWALLLYGALGLLAAVPLHLRGLATIDPAVPGSGWRFRALITPGMVAFWPLLLKRWLVDGSTETTPDRWSGTMSPRRHRAAHGLLIQLLAVLIPLLCGAGLLARSAATQGGDPPGEPGAPTVARGE